MKLTAARPLERLSAINERPEAAVFCTFTFDPIFFEEQVLRAVLQIASDPEQQPARYHEDCRRALQECPVACIVDAEVRGTGHRLPYDLLEVSTRVFHPKVALLLFDAGAKLLVGSGNLTRGGYGENAETFVERDLLYATPKDAAVLREVVAFLRGLTALVRNPGTQLAIAVALLERRIAATPEPETRSIVFLHSLGEPLLSQFTNLLPTNRTITRIGALAPFFERDDVPSASDDDATSVLQSISGLPNATNVRIDVAALWDDPPLAIGACETETDLTKGIGRLWAWFDASSESDNDAVEYRRLVSVSARQVELTDRHGKVRRVSREDVEGAIEERSFGRVGPIRAFAPRRLVGHLRETKDLTFWLHPARRLVDQKPKRRPLHAKLFLFTTEGKKDATTLVIVGSPNPSRRALLLPVRDGGNVECAFAFRVPGELALPDICPELVACPLELVSLEERTYPIGEPDFGAWIESAVHDAEQRSLTVSWAETGPTPFGDWELRYLDRVVARGRGAPTTPTLAGDFFLSASSCELELATDNRIFSIPILVADLAMLPVSPHLADLSLRELLALLGHRVGGERLGALRAERGAKGMGTLLEAIFGEGFGPTDVFKAYWCVAADLADPTLSAQSFRLRLEGALGLGTLWRRLCDAVSDQQGAADHLSNDELWFYGAELARTLSKVPIEEGPLHDEKRSLLDAFLARVRKDIAPLTPTTDRAAWVLPVLEHYGVRPRVQEVS